GQHQAAESEIRLGLAINEKLVAEDARRMDQQGHLSWGHHLLGLTFEARSRIAEAEVEYREAIRLGAPVADHFADKHEYRREFAQRQAALVKLLNESGRLQEALPLVQEIVETMERVIAKSPQDPVFQDVLLRARCQLANLLDDLDRHADAEEEFRRVIQEGT